MTTTPDQTNPYQQPLGEELSFPEAVRVIAERTAFRTEPERDAVYAACDKQAERERSQGADEPEPDDTGSVPPAE